MTAPIAWTVASLAFAIAVWQLVYVFGGLSERILPLTSQLIFSVAAVVSYVGTIITLVPSDLIATGTPAGAGAARTPPRFLADGETVVTSLEGLGEQRNPCVAEQAVASCK